MLSKAIAAFRFLVCVAVIATAGAQNLAFASDDGIEVFRGQYLVHTPAKLGINGEAEPPDFGPVATVKRRTEGFSLVELNIQAFGGAENGDIVPFDAEEAERWCARLRQQTPVTLCEPNVVWKISAVPNDPLFTQLYAMKKIAADAAWDTLTDASRIIVAVADTGVDYTHPDLAANMWRNLDEIPGNGIDDDGNGYIDDVYGADSINRDGDPFDDHGHGTHCAGTIGGVGNNGNGVTGVAWKTQIMALKFLGAKGGGSTFDAISLIDYAIEKKANVINASWGGYFGSEALKQAIRRANDAGIIFVAAAGNSASDNDARPHFPSSFDLPNIISVAATDEHDNLAYFSNYGSNSVDIAAPGTLILSTVPGGYGRLSGTSMAAPHVAGLAALTWAAHPKEGAGSIMARISNGDRLSSLNGLVATGRRINAQRAITGDAPEGGFTSVEPKYFSPTHAPGRQHVVRNRSFTMVFAGSPGAPFSANLSFAGGSEEGCYLGSFNLDQTGMFALQGRLKLTGAARRLTRRAILVADGLPLTRRVRGPRNHRGDNRAEVHKVNRKLKQRAKARFRRSVSRSCELIRSTLHQL